MTGRRRPQKGKGRKRKRSWHRGGGEARLYAHNELPDVGSGADPTGGAPTPVHRVYGPGGEYRGETA